MKNLTVFMVRLLFLAAGTTTIVIGFMHPASYSNDEKLQAILVAAALIFTGATLVYRVIYRVIKNIKPV